MAKSPDAYPVAFHAVLRAGGGVLEAVNLPWTTKSARVRFYHFLEALRESSGHPLKVAARLEWSVVATPLTLVISRPQRSVRGVPDIDVLKKVLDEAPRPG